MSIQLRNWSLKSRIASAVWFALGVTLVLCIVQQDQSPATRTDHGKQAIPSNLKTLPSAGPLELAPFDPRRVNPVALGASKSTGKQDDAWGQCPAFTHYHATPAEVLSNGGYDAGPGHNFDLWYGIVSLDGLCHDDKTDEPIKERPKLPKPKPNPKDVWL